jgi:hypothetical protein
VTSQKFWRILSYVLAAALFTCVAALRIHIGYPAAWDKVQAGMTISQVREICGLPTHEGYVHPESWEAPCLLGRWMLVVTHSDAVQESIAIVSTVRVYYVHPLLPTPIKHHSIEPPVKDYDAFFRAFAQERKLTPYERARNDAANMNRPLEHERRRNENQTP